MLLEMHSQRKASICMWTYPQAFTPAMRMLYRLEMAAMKSLRALCSARMGILCASFRINRQSLGRAVSNSCKAARHKEIFKRAGDRVIVTRCLAIRWENRDHIGELQAQAWLPMTCKISASTPCRN